MVDHLAIIRERLAKAEAREQRHEKAAELARTEANDFRTALRVLEEVMDAPEGAHAGGGGSAAGVAVADRQLSIVRLLRVGENLASAPAEIFERYKQFAEQDLSIDTFRTTIWRMRNNSYRDGPDLWLIKGENGRYWKVPGTLETRKRHEGQHEEEQRKIIAETFLNVAEEHEEEEYEVVVVDDDDL